MMWLIYYANMQIYSKGKISGECYIYIQIKVQYMSTVCRNKYNNNNTDRKSPHAVQIGSIDPKRHNPSTAIKEWNGTCCLMTSSIAPQDDAR